MAKRAWVMRTAVMVSILAHASLIGAAGLRKPVQVPVEPPPIGDVWAGTTAMPVGSEELLDVDVMGGSAAETPPAAPPAPAMPVADETHDDAIVEPAKPAPVPDKPVATDKPSVPDKPAPKAPAKTPEAPKPKPLAAKPETPDTKDDPSSDTPASTSRSTSRSTSTSTPETTEPKDPAPADQDKLNDQDKPVARDEPARGPDPGPDPDADKKPARTAKRNKPTPAAPAAAAPSDAMPDGSAKAPSGGSFGAEGTASVRDLGRAFTRAMPPACDSDKVWGTLATGSAGSIEVVVTISEEGKISGFEPITKNPPAHLMSTVKRTLALLQGGVFAIAGGSVTAGRQVLRLSVELSDTAVTEDEAKSATAFGLESHWEGRKGVASFTQSGGRHVEITVEFVRVLPN